MKTLSLIWRFYLNFAFVGLLISALCAYALYLNGIATFAALFWFKILSSASFCFAVNRIKKSEFTYYRNLGLTKPMLWTPGLIIDFLLFVLLVILSLTIR